MYICINVKYPFFLSHINETWIFTPDYREVPKYQISWRSVLWQPCGRTDRQTDRQTDRHDEANNRFSKFCERA